MGEGRKGEKWRKKYSLIKTIKKIRELSLETVINQFVTMETHHLINFSRSHFSKFLLQNSIT